MLNFAILRHPMNWITVLLMVAIGSFAYQAGANFVHGKTAE